MPPPAPPPCMDAEEMWDCISTCHSSDNGQKTSCKDKCNRCPASPSPPPSPVPSPPPMPPPAPPKCVENDPTNQCKCGPFQELTKIWDPNCCVFTVGSTCPASTPGSASCCTNLDLLPPPSPPPSPKISPPPPPASPSPPPMPSPAPPPCMDAEEMWDCISSCHSSDNGQKTSCKDKCNRCPASPSPPPSPVPSPPP